MQSKSDVRKASRIVVSEFWLYMYSAGKVVTNSLPRSSRVENNCIQLYTICPIR